MHGRLQKRTFAGVEYESATSICNGCGEPWEAQADGFNKSVTVTRWGVEDGEDEPSKGN